MSGQIHTHDDFQSEVLSSQRKVIVYTPPGYAKDPRRQFPILYLHDGQNVFDGNTSFVPGQYWMMGEAADHLIHERQIEPLVMVAIYHANEHRLTEYTPTHAPKLGGGGVELHGRMMVQELKPFIDSRYRILPLARHTGVCGSSLGGLASLYLGLKYPDVYGKLAIMSPSVWWDNRVILRRLTQLEALPRPHVWLDIGTAEGRTPNASTKDARLLRDILISKGWRLGSNFQYLEVEGADHSERAWAARVPQMLKFLYPRKSHVHRS